MNEHNYDEQQYVVFRLGVEVFGLKINCVKEIITHQETTHVPGTGQLIEGIINLRGRVIPIYSLRKKFGFPEVQKARSTRIVVLDVHDNTMGVEVDGVSEVLIIPANVIEEPTAMISAGIDENYISGIAKMADNLIILLDLEKVILPSIAEAI